MSEQKPFEALIDYEHQIIQIQGIKYTFDLFNALGDLFNALGFCAEGVRFEVGKRGDGVVELRTIPKE